MNNNGIHETMAKAMKQVTDEFVKRTGGEVDWEKIKNVRPLDIEKLKFENQVIDELFHHPALQEIFQVKIPEWLRESQGKFIGMLPPGFYRDYRMSRMRVNLAEHVIRLGLNGKINIPDFVVCMDHNLVDWWSDSGNGRKSVMKTLYRDGSMDIAWTQYFLSTPEWKQYLQDKQEGLEVEPAVQLYRVTGKFKRIGGLLMNRLPKENLVKFTVEDLLKTYKG